MKVLIHKLTGSFGHYMGRGEFAECSIPQIFPNTMNKNTFKKYVSEYEGVPLNIDNWEIKEIDIKIK